jgi:hypothetical protein
VHLSCIYRLASKRSMNDHAPKRASNIDVFPEPCYRSKRASNREYIYCRTNNEIQTSLLKEEFVLNLETKLSFRRCRRPVIRFLRPRKRGITETNTIRFLSFEYCRRLRRKFVKQFSLERSEKEAAWRKGSYLCQKVFNSIDRDLAFDDSIPEIEEIVDPHTHQIENGQRAKHDRGRQLSSHDQSLLSW